MRVTYGGRSKSVQPLRKQIASVHSKLECDQHHAQHTTPVSTHSGAPNLSLSLPLLCQLPRREGLALALRMHLQLLLPRLQL